ncbi:MAG: M3 family oligoendopeptidase [Chloroflexi bacterium]|nr:M3 family oligoendopeptidase [Chloroflexota bacterium]MCC6893131.1 M3 family oligoendopeptidase [Anaerolineae bacterium]
MQATLPTTTDEFVNWSWSQIEPFYAELEARPLAADTVATWLADWTLLLRLMSETGNRLEIATTVNTEDEEAVKRLQNFLKNIAEPAAIAEHKLQEKILASGLEPVGFEIALRNMRAEAADFREANVPLVTKERELSLEYNQIVGAQTVTWEGEELTITQVKLKMQTDDRSVREAVWKAIAARRLADRSALNTLWTKFLPLRLQMASNAGYANYRDLRWRQFRRFEYSPDDCIRFHESIETVVVPAATRIYDKQRQKLGVDTLRPWDLDRDDVYPPSRPPLHPFDTVEELVSKVDAILHKVDPELGDYFTIMRKENLLDLDNRKGKAPGGYQAGLVQSKRPFIFMNAVGTQNDVQTLLHEAGHAFHLFEALKLPYSQQWEYTSEIAEVASMSMELLAAPYLKASDGGFYTPQEAARAEIEHLEQNILFWPFMAVVDAFQHWVYSNPAQAADTANCDAVWGDLWARFIPGVDWSGLEDSRVTGWHRKLHIFQIPFYYVDYGLAQVGAQQVWRNSLKDKAKAVRDYRAALALGGTRPLPELFEAAGAKFEFDIETLGELVEVTEEHIGELEKV